MCVMNGDTKTETTVIEDRPTSAEQQIEEEEIVEAVIEEEVGEERVVGEGKGVTCVETSVGVPVGGRCMGKRRGASKYPFILF